MVNPFLIHSKDRVPEEPELQEIFVDPELRKRVSEAEEAKLRAAVRKSIQFSEYEMPLIQRVWDFYLDALKDMSKTDGPVEVAGETFVCDFSSIVCTETLRVREFEKYLSNHPRASDFYSWVERLTSSSGQTQEQAMFQIRNQLITDGVLKPTWFVDIQTKELTGKELPLLLLLDGKNVESFVELHSRYGGRIPQKELRGLGIVTNNRKVNSETRERIAALILDKTEEAGYEFLKTCIDEWDEMGDRVAWSRSKQPEDVKAGSVDRFRKSLVYRQVFENSRDDIDKIVNGFMTDNCTNMLRVGKDQYIVRFRGKGGTKFRYMNIPNTEAQKFRSRISGDYDVTGYTVSGPNTLEVKIKQNLRERYAKFTPEKIHP